MSSSFMREGRTSSYCTLIKDAEKESKSVEKRDNGGKVRAVTVRHPLHTQLHTTPALLVPRWQAWAYRHAAATDSPHLASSEYSLARLRADRTISLHLSETLGTRNLRCLHFSVSKYSIAQNNSWALHCFMAQFDHSSCGRESLLHAPKLV